MTKMAILHHPRSIHQKELRAASEGLMEFRRFGVSFKELSVEGSISGVKRGVVLKDSIYSSEFPIHPFDLCHIPPLEFLGGLFRPKDTIGLALTGAILFEEGDRTKRLLGVSAHGIGGIVSLSRLREVCYAEQKLGAIKLAVMHEAGHILGRKDHCANENCLMQENKNHIDFLDRFVERNLGFCRDCLDAVAQGVSELDSFRG